MKKCGECGKLLPNGRRKWCSKKCADVDYQRRNREALNLRMRKKYREDPVHRAKHIRLVKERQAKIKRDEKR